MRFKLAAGLVLVAVLIMTTLNTVTVTRPAVAAPGDNDAPGPRWPINGYPPRESDNAILKWDEELLQTIRKYPAQTGPTVTSPGPSGCSTPPPTTPGPPTTPPPSRPWPTATRG